MVKRIMNLCSFCMIVLLISCAATNERAKEIAGSEPAVMIDFKNGIFKDTRTGLMWQKERGPLLTNIDEARLYVKKLNLGGYNDWRLPTVFELYELNFTFDFKKTESLSIKREGSYWSLSGEDDGRAGAWETGQQCEVERNYFKRSKGYVRAVRS